MVVGLKSLSLIYFMQQEFVIQEALEEHDKNGDGFVSLEEFLGDYRRDPGKQPRGCVGKGGRGQMEVKKKKQEELGLILACSAKLNTTQAQQRDSHLI